MTVVLLALIKKYYYPDLSPIMTSYYYYYPDLTFFKLQNDRLITLTCACGEK